MIKKLKKQLKNKIGGKNYGIVIRNIIIIFLLGIIALICGLFYIYFSLNNPKINIPKRPDNVPINAIWNGGPDGGMWYELLSIKDSIYRFRVYSEYNGELYMDCDYKLKYKPITTDNWHKINPFYNGDIDSLQIIHTNHYLYFESIYPAYGGKDWKIIKEKYKIE